MLIACTACFLSDNSQGYLRSCRMRVTSSACNHAGASAWLPAAWLPPSSSPCQRSTFSTAKMTGSQAGRLRSAPDSLLLACGPVLPNTQRNVVSGYGLQALNMSTCLCHALEAAGQACTCLHFQHKLVHGPGAVGDLHQPIARLSESSQLSEAWKHCSCWLLTGL